MNATTTLPYAARCYIDANGQRAHAIRYDGSAACAEAIREWLGNGEYCMDGSLLLANDDTEIHIPAGPYIVRLDGLRHEVPWPAARFESKFTETGTS